MAARRQAPEDPMATPPAVQPPIQATPTWPANPAIPGVPISQPPNTINTWTAPPEASPTSQYVPGAGMTSVVPILSSPTGTTHPKATEQYPPTTATYNPPTESLQPSHPPLHKKPQTTGFSTGILAGAIGGSIVGSTLLTLIAAYLFFGRRKSRGGNNLEGRQTREPLVDKNYDIETACSREHFSSNVPFAGNTDKTNTAGSLDLHAEKSGLGSYIPTPADDKTVESRILTVFDHLALHVENYYTSSSPSNFESEHLSQCVAMLSSYNSPFLPAPVVSLLSQSNDREPIIKHCLVQSLIPATFHAAPSSASRSEVTSFLPPPFTAARDFHEMQVQDQEESQVHFYWRMLTARSYRGVPDTQKQAYLSTRAENISKAVDAFTAAFRPFANPQHLESERIRHLTKVMEDAAELGIWLFEQPCGFQFIWSNLAAGQVVVSPAVVKVSDGHGKLLQTTKTIVKADTACYI
ncbi:uncharacterized protein ARB_03671 [Trichophyton benhamiae CBS 112371]|uniref:Uncharacterized protein n=1 Tax=Arthroderma benhamiae (strain ATCC MYA-4681 / CBS 112371) TaxID=663331 RepID=D4B5D1_ARTBC|nr:uncharacterized protein ARB_03671 [Trichophyton benhamiae CBS 112371]EFE29464.1 hypothetical protein ARB_03671 [Trichophyton benhamiae CBS 112371]